LGRATNCKSKGVRFGVNKTFLKDSIYKPQCSKDSRVRGIAIEFELAKVDLEGFGTLLNADMRIDLQII
jgi:hypothetical protein